MSTRKSVLIIFALLFGSVSHADSVVPKVELDCPLVAAGQKTTVYALIDFEVAAAAENHKRQDINLALVIDRSGSMADKGKIKYAKKAAKIVIDSLHASDRISVVEYDDVVSVLWPSSLVESPKTIKSMIDRLSPRNSTNLSGGMRKGVDEVAKNLDPGRLNRVILLSDGKANRGVTNPHAIKHFARQAKAKGMHISTMGLGMDYNEDLMETIAESGGGNYYFIEHPTQMSRIFKNELSILFSTVAKDVRLQFDASAAIVKSEFIGFAPQHQGRKLELQPEDFYSSEKRTLVLRLEVQARPDGPSNLGNLVLSYFDVLQNKKVSREQTLQVRASTDLAQVRKSQNKKVVAESTLFEANHKHAQSVRLYEKGQKKNALEQIKQLARDLNQKNQALADVRIAKKIEALDMETEEMSAADKTAWSRYRYLKSSKIRYYKSKRGGHGLYVLQEGDFGREVEDLQRNLKRLKLYSGPIDGIFDADVKVAVKAFQRRQNVDDDGIVGPKTMKKLGVY